MGLESKKIDSTLKQLENAAKGAVRSLNEMTNNEFKGSVLEKDPLANIGSIAFILQTAKTQAAANARYEGLNEDEVAQLQEAEREAEKEDLQKLVQEKLAARQPQEPEAETPEIPDSDQNQ